MPPEVTEEVVETPVQTEEPEPSDSEATDDFNAGFTKESHTEPTATPAASEMAPAEVPAETASTTPAEEPKEPKYVQVTEEQLQQLLSGLTEIGTIKAGMGKLRDDAFGRLGGLERFFKDLQASTPAGQKLNVSAEDFEEMRADFPELTDMTIKGLNRALSKMTGTGSAMTEDRIGELVTSKASEEAVKIRKQEAIEFLADEHPDWETIVGKEGSTTEYRKWLATQPEAYQQKINDSWNPFLVAKSIDRFLKSDAAKAKPRTDPAAARRAQLSAAVTPRGAGGNPPSRSEDDEFNEGFRQESGGSR